MAAKEIKAGIKITGKNDSGGAFASLSRSMSHAERKFAGFQKSLSGVASGFGMAFGGIAVAGAAVGGAAIGVGAAILKMTRTTATYLDEIGKFARQTGLDVKLLQQLEYAAERNGIAAATARKSWAFFNKSLGEMRIGTGKMHTDLKKIDPVLARQIKSTSNSTDALRLYFQAIQKTTDPIKRTSLAVTAFGRSGTVMTRIVDGQKGSLEALMKEAEKYGLMTEKDTKKAEQYKDVELNLDRAFRGLKFSLAVGIMPALTDATQKMADFFAENRPEIVQAFADVTKTAGDMVGNLVKHLTDNPDAFTNFIGNAAGTVEKVLMTFREIGDVIDFIRGERNRQDIALKGRQKVGFIPTPAEAQSGTASASRFGGARGFMGNTGVDAVVGKGIGALGFRGGMGGMLGFAAAMTTVIQPEMKLVVDFKNVPRDIQPSVNTSDPRLKVSEGTPDYFSPGAFE